VKTREISSCAGKRTYLTFKEAKGAAQRSTRQYETRLAPYKCHYCGRYHVGKPLEKKRPACAGNRHLRGGSGG
jgi:hypothetical protein